MPRFRFAAILALLLSACAAPPPSQPTNTLRPTDPPQTEEAPAETAEPTDPATSEATKAPNHADEWREDLQRLVEFIGETHPRPYVRTSEADFAAAVADLDARLPELSDTQVFFELMRITSLIDGHSYVSIEIQEYAAMDIYPLRLYPFSDGTFIVDAHEPYRDAVGAKLISIGGTPIDEVFAAVGEYVPHDNSQTVALMVAWFSLYPDLLLHLGIIEDAAQPEFVIEMADGTTTTLNPQAIPRMDYGEGWLDAFSTPMGLPQRSDTLYLMHRTDDVFWHTYLPEGEVLYIQYNGVQTIPPQEREALEADLAANPIRKVVLDIRHNPGGDIQFYEPLLEILSGEAVNGQGKLYVIIGRQTFSAAMLLTVDLEQQTDAVFVGEPTGARPHVTGDVVPVRLPNSGLTVLISDLDYNYTDGPDDREWIEPDISAPLSSADFFAGVDPAMAAILALP